MPVDQRYFEDLEIGEVYENPSQTVTDAHFLFFSALSGDFNPLHLDRTYAAKRPAFEGRVAHGMLVTLFTVVGASPLSRELEDSMIAFLNQSTRFLEPVYVGDTVYPELEIVDLEGDGERGVVGLASRVDNQDGERVLEGHLELLVAKRRGDS